MKLTLPVAILAGGRATRLGALAQQTPKALIEVAGRPFVAHQLDWLKRQGAGRVVLCVGYLGDQIQATIGDGRAFGLDIQYSFDGPTLLGTGGALREAISLLGGAFFVLYGDSYLSCDCVAVERAFFQSKKEGIMTVLCNAGRWDRSNILFSDGQILQYDKRHPTPDMRHIDYGIGIVSARAFSPYPNAGDTATVDLSVVYEGLVARGEMAGFEVADRFYEIGSTAGLEETRRYLATLNK